MPQSRQTHDLADADWRISTFSAPDGACVAVACLRHDTVALRNSNRPDDGHLVFTTAELAGFLTGVRAGDLDPSGSPLPDPEPA